MDKFKKELTDFIEKSTCSYTAVEEIKNVLNGKNAQYFGNIVFF